MEIYTISIPLILWTILAGVFWFFVIKKVVSFLRKSKK